MNKKEIKKFIDTHRDLKFSAAKMEYSIYSDWETNEKVIELANQRVPETKVDMEMKMLIEQTDEPREILNLMRKELSGANRSLLRTKYLNMKIPLNH